jgi:ParB family chromosome partitioning protein
MAIIKVALDKIYPNPYQPASRLDPGEEANGKIGTSILEVGLILTPVGRKVESVYEMGDGWQRLKGFQWLVDHGHTDYQEIPIDVRELSDQQMADLVIEANKNRKDLNDIEQAEFYQRYMKEFGVSQQELARRYNCSQGEIANTLRLLELPEPVKTAVISQEITGTHGRQLLRLNKHPELQEKFVDALKENPVSVSKLDLEISRNLFQTSKPVFKSHEWNHPIFDLEECEKCEYRVMLADPYGQDKKQARCTKSECWEKKQAAAQAKKDAVAKKRLEKKSGDKKVLTSDDLRYGQYTDMQDWNGSYRNTLDDPDECEKCPKKALFKYHADSEGDPKPICLDPKCFSKKKGKRTRELNKQRKIDEKALTVRIGEIAEKVSKNRHGALVVALRDLIRHMPAAARDDVASLYDDLPKHSNGRLRPEILKAKVLTMSEPQLIKLIAAILISTRRRGDSYEQYSTKLKDDLLTEVAILEGTYDLKAADLSAFQEANCTGCPHAIPELISSGEICCKENSSYYREIKGGICKTSPNAEALRKNKKNSKNNNNNGHKKQPAASATA